MLTFPHMGNACVVAKVFLDSLGVPCIIPPYNNKKALEIGVKYAPEMACLPLKLNIGNLVEAKNLGADTVLIPGGCGPCRFGYYCELHREILKDMGIPMEVLTLEMPKGDIREFIQRIKKITGTLNPAKILKALHRAANVSKYLDALEKLSFKIRAREFKKGSVDKIYDNFKKKVISLSDYHKVMKFISATKNELMRVDYNNSISPIKIGIVGEIYTTIDPFSNFYLESKLGNMGVEVDRSITISGWIIEHMLKPVFKLPRNLEYAKAAKPYLGAMIGGHAQETIGNTILYAKDGYDGVIQVYPLTCMPEIVAQSILPSIEKDFDIPVITIIIDEMAGEAGYQTRLEAFYDLLCERRERKRFAKRLVLPGN